MERQKLPHYSSYRENVPIDKEKKLIYSPSNHN